MQGMLEQIDSSNFNRLRNSLLYNETQDEASILRPFTQKEWNKLEQGPANR